MERPTDELVQRLLAAVAAGAGSDVTRLVEEARAEAEAEVKDVVKAAVKAVLLRRAVDELERGQAAPPPAAAPVRPGPTVEDPVARDVSTEPAHPVGRDAAAGVEPTLCYVYAITRVTWGAPPADLPSVDRHSRLRTIAAGDLQAVVSDVPVAEFGPEVVEERLKNLQWVEEKVRAHDAAVKALSAAGTVIPCRFCTILSGEDEARAALTRHHDAVVRTLGSIDGKTEWGVKLMADTRASASAVAGGTSADPADVTGEAGRAYLMQKKRTGRQREDVVRAAAGAAEACHRELFALAADAAILPTRDRGGSARGWHLALNAAYLVPDGDADAFHARVAALARQYRTQGLRIDLTGPWPPYNFSALELSEAPAS